MPPATSTNMNEEISNEGEDQAAFTRSAQVVVVPRMPFVAMIMTLVIVTVFGCHSGTAPFTQKRRPGKSQAAAQAVLPVIRRYYSTKSAVTPQRALRGAGTASEAQCSEPCSSN